MQKSNLVYYAAVALSMAAIAAVIVFKFVIPGDNPNQFKIENTEEIVLTDLDGNSVALESLLRHHDSTFCLLFELSSCYSCIYNGLVDLKTLKDSGNHCIAVAVHDRLDDIEGWSEKQEFSPFFMLKKVDFYRHIHSPVLPVLIQLTGHTVKKFKYILP